MNLSEIKVQYEGNKCKKCSRVLKKGWSVFFDKDTKDLYCKPCGTIIQNEVEPSLIEESEKVEESERSNQKFFEIITNLNDLKKSQEHTHKQVVLILEYLMRHTADTEKTLTQIHLLEKGTVSDIASLVADVGSLIAGSSPVKASTKKRT